MSRRAAECAQAMRSAERWKTPSESAEEKRAEADRLAAMVAEWVADGGRVQRLDNLGRVVELKANTTQTSSYAAAWRRGSGGGSGRNCTIGGSATGPAGSG